MNRKQDFVDAILKMYLALPDTPDRFNSNDCFVAKAWFEQGISILQVQQAMTLAQIRRGFRRSDDIPLNPIRSLHYFVPIIQEIQTQPMDEKYFRYLQLKLKQITNLNANSNGTRSNSSDPT